MAAKPAAGLRSFISAQRSELRQNHAEVEPAVIDSFLMWVTCQTLSNDGTLTGPQKFDKYADLYRMLNEPAKAAPHSE